MTINTLTRVFNEVRVSPAAADDSNSGMDRRVQTDRGRQTDDRHAADAETTEAKHYIGWTDKWPAEETDDGDVITICLPAGSGDTNIW